MTTDIVLGVDEYYVANRLSSLDKASLIGLCNLVMFDNYIKNINTFYFMKSMTNGIYNSLAQQTKIFDVLLPVHEKAYGWKLMLIVPQFLRESGTTISFETFPATDYINQGDQITQLWPLDDLLIHHQQKYPDVRVAIVPYKYRNTYYQLVFNKI